MKIEGNTIYFEKLVESNPVRRQGEIGASQSISIPQPAAVSSCTNAKGDFSTDWQVLTSEMRRLSSQVASIELQASV